MTSRFNVAIAVTALLIGVGVAEGFFFVNGMLQCGNAADGVLEMALSLLLLGKPTFFFPALTLAIILIVAGGSVGRAMRPEQSMGVAGIAFALALIVVVICGIVLPHADGCSMGY